MVVAGACPHSARARAENPYGARFAFGGTGAATATSSSAGYCRAQHPWCCLFYGHPGAGRSQQRSPKKSRPLSPKLSTSPRENPEARRASRSSAAGTGMRGEGRSRDDCRGELRSNASRRSGSAMRKAAEVLGTGVLVRRCGQAAGAGARSAHSPQGNGMHGPDARQRLSQRRWRVAAAPAGSADGMALKVSTRTCARPPLRCRLLVSTAARSASTE